MTMENKPLLQVKDLTVTFGEPVSYTHLLHKNVGNGGMAKWRNSDNRLNRGFPP